uniref:Uncharacterized protein n=1 Tax=Cacopsylla melanoneura TaxID=428564 RepID=A0A8D9BC23_9HEMI
MLQLYAVFCFLQLLVWLTLVLLHSHWWIPVLRSQMNNGLTLRYPSRTPVSPMAQRSTMTLWSILQMMLQLVYREALDWEIQRWKKNTNHKDEAFLQVTTPD